MHRFAIGVPLNGARLLYELSRGCIWPSWAVLVHLHGMTVLGLISSSSVGQIVEALRACHATGIVHRDVKPQNVILSGPDRRAKLIDLGAAADLRIGINYVPNEFLLDPRYAPPEQYIMSTQVRNCVPISVTWV